MSYLKKKRIRPIVRFKIIFSKANIMLIKRNIMLINCNCVHKIDQIVLVSKSILIHAGRISIRGALGSRYALSCCSCSYFILACCKLTFKTISQMSCHYAIMIVTHILPITRLHSNAAVSVNLLNTRELH